MDYETDSSNAESCIIVEDTNDREGDLSEQLFHILTSLRKPEGQSRKSRVSEDCLDSLRYIKEQLRYEDDLSSDIYCHLWKWNILEKDLIPIFLENKNIKDENQKNLAIACVELFVMMTSPIDPSILDTSNEFEEDCDLSQLSRKMNERLKSQTDYKVIFVKNPMTLRIIRDLLNLYLSDEKRKIGRRSKDDNNIINSLLNFYKNLVSIKDPPTLHLTGIELQHKLVILFQEEKIFETFFNLISKERELSQWNLIIQEIFYHIFYNMDPSDLIKDPKVEAENRAKKLLNEELNKKAAKLTRNTHYNGTYWVNVPGKEYTVHKQDAIRGLGVKAVDAIKKEKPMRTPPTVCLGTWWFARILIIIYNITQKC
ncbi:hypothetical protein Glove_103g30 [Diversispora epigaea]|uniref:Timeless N-terminal domain-containing protein n=1 Tax=Diversispora epigaea TaxID=1348612 RepID=A0A397J3R0_9GLOM|nr:hypothetical protein Glove_103g30 [Diversispora epigaea]